MIRQCLLTPVVLGIAFAVVSTLGEAKSKRLHVTAQAAQQTLLGDPASPQLGDRIITTVDLFDDRGTRVGTGGASCTIVSVPPLDTRVECLLTAVLAEGQIMFGGWPRWPRWGPQRGSVFWAARATFATPVAKRWPS